MEDSKIKAKKIECFIGILFLIPPILGVIAFILCLFGCEWEFATLDNMSHEWTSLVHYQAGGGGMSATPIYLGLMALTGVWLVKDSIQYLFTKK